MSALPALCALASCGKTVDSVGYNGRGGVRLNKVTGPTTYPTPFKGLSKTDNEIATKIADTFQQLFYGDPNLQAIYVPMGTEQAYIQDTLHGDVTHRGDRPGDDDLPSSSTSAPSSIGSGPTSTK